MSLVTLGPPGAPGAAVTGGRVILPRIGAWTADLTVDSTEALEGRVALQLGEAAALVGTVVPGRAELYEGMFRTRVVGGAGGLGTLADPLHYTQPAFRTVLERLASDAGEAVSATADAAVLGEVLRRWTVLGDQTAGRAIQLLVARAAPAGTAWRVLDDGTIWVGAETWPESDAAAVVVAETPEDATLELGLEQPLVRPGTVLDGRRVDCSEIVIGGGSIRATIWTAPET